MADTVEACLSVVMTMAIMVRDRVVLVLAAASVDRVAVLAGIANPPNLRIEL
jgi:hypothetical protein